MTPTTRILHAWNVKTPSTNGGDPAAHALPSPQSLDRAYTDLEGDTLIDELVEGIKDDEAFDANEETIVVDESGYDSKAYNPVAERMRREAQGRELRAAGWSEDAVFLFQKLGMRGFEPLMPSSWAFNFVMFPEMMFTKNMDKAYIKATYGSDYHAEKALEQLLQVGARARDAVLTKAPLRTAEFHIGRAVSVYNKWALKDGDVNHSWNLPLFEIVTGTKHVPTTVLQDKMLRKLGNLGDRWRDALQIHSSVEGGEGSSRSSQNSSVRRDFVREPPTLYGVIASHTIMGFVCYDIMDPNPQLRTVAIFDFSREDYDVWNGMALAIFVIHCRNRMMELKDDLPQYSSSEFIDDPDA